MANAMSKSQLAAAIADKAGLKKKQAVEILELIADLAYKNAKNTFTLPGIGKLALDSVLTLDLPVLTATVLVAAFFVVLMNTIVDMLYAVLDPRVRVG